MVMVWGGAEGEEVGKVTRVKVWMVWGGGW